MHVTQKIGIWAIIIVLIASFWQCGRDSQRESKPLVRVGDRTITTDEFIRRAEYTVRPPYCRGNYPYDKKIILNSLIAEKLLALECDTTQVFKENHQAASYLKGRKEQAMRQYHYYQHGFQKAQVDSNRLKQAYRFAGRKYELAYCRFTNPAVARQIIALLDQGNFSFAEICTRTFGIQEIPQRNLTFNDEMDINVFERLFMQGVAKGQILPPIKASDGSYVFLKVKGWTSGVALGSTQQSERYHQVQEKLKAMEAQRIYNNYVQQLMQGKRLDFNESTFFQLADLYKEVYFASVKESKKVLSQQLWNREVDLTLPDSLGDRLSNLNKQPFFRVDGETWTVKDFRQAVLSHPLVFRKDDIAPGEFANQFRLAVADLIRDKYINADAYRNGYGKVTPVQQYKAMWKDNILAIYTKQRILQNWGVSKQATDHPVAIIENYLNPYIDSLQNVYDEKIQINVPAFNEIQLTDIDMFVLQKKTAYPIVVPGFPLLTTDSNLDYGRKMTD